VAGFKCRSAFFVSLALTLTWGRTFDTLLTKADGLDGVAFFSHDNMALGRMAWGRLGLVIALKAQLGQARVFSHLLCSHFYGFLPCLNKQPMLGYAVAVSFNKRLFPQNAFWVYQRHWRVS
jgi:acyl-CoA synthetase (AMP-forming)/AMP-acid ligase II